MLWLSINNNSQWSLIIIITYFILKRDLIMTSTLRSNKKKITNKRLFSQIARWLYRISIEFNRLDQIRRSRPREKTRFCQSRPTDRQIDGARRWRRDTYCSSSLSRSWAAWSRTVHCESAAAVDADARGRWPAGARGAGSAPPCLSDDDRDDDECCPPGRIDLRPCRLSASAGAAVRRLHRPKPRCLSSCCWARCCWLRLRLENGRH